MVACPECGFDSKDPAYCDRCGRAFAVVARPSSTPPALDIPNGFARLSDRFAFPAAYDWTEALLVVEALAAAVEPIHRLGRVHGRLDPREIAEGPTREMRLLRVDECAPDGTPAEGRVVVPGYSAPEVYGRGTGRLTFATDVFSLGAVLWRLVTGRDPYVDFDDLALTYPSPRLLVPAPFDLDPLLSGTLALRSSARFQSLDELRAAMRRVRGRVYARAHFEGAVQLAAASAIDIGRAKGAAYPVNQDAVVCDTVSEGALFAAVDGVTHADVGTGELAAELTRAALVASREVSLSARFERANDAVIARVNADAPDYAGDPSGVMGAAVVAAEWRGGLLSFAWLGDARAYLFRDGDLIQLSIDHDAATDAIRAGKSPRDAREISNGGRLTRAIGTGARDEAGRLVVAPLETELLDVRLFPGDRVLITTDGIPDWIGGDERSSLAAMATILAESSNPSDAATRLVAAANAGGGGDNLSCVVLFAVAT